MRGTAALGLLGTVTSRPHCVGYSVLGTL